jgi:hypothetical protein
MLIQHRYFVKSKADNGPQPWYEWRMTSHEPFRPPELRVTFLLPGAQYQHQGLPHAAKGRLPVALGRGAFSYLADRIDRPEPNLYGAIALGFWFYATVSSLLQIALRGAGIFSRQPHGKSCLFNYDSCRLGRETTQSRNPNLTTHEVLGRAKASWALASPSRSL